MYTIMLSQHITFLFQTLRLDSCCDLHTNLFMTCGKIYKDLVLEWVCGEPSRHKLASLVKFGLEDV